MKVLEDAIEDNKHNYTRFLVVSNPMKADFLRPLNEADKASLVFSLPHEEGSLSKVLTILSFYGINLTKIQSLPVIGHEWEYMFYVDVTYTDMGIYVLCGCDLYRPHPISSVNRRYHSSYQGTEDIGRV